MENEKEETTVKKDSKLIDVLMRLATSVHLFKNKKKQVAKIEECYKITLKEARFWLEVKGACGTFDDFVDFVKYCLKEVDGFPEWFIKSFKSKDDLPMYAKIDDGIYLDMRELRLSYQEMRDTNRIGGG